MKVRTVPRVRQDALDGHEVTRDDAPQRHGPARAQPAKRPRGDEALDATGARTPRRCEREDDQAPDEERLAPHGIGQAAQERLKGRRGEQEGRREPRRLVGGAKVGCDDRVRARHDGAVEAADELGCEYLRKDEPETTGGGVVQEG